MKDDNYFKKLMVLGIGGVMLTNASYYIGSYKGFHEGKIRGKEETIELLDMERYDAHQNAKYAGSLERQNEILRNAETVKRTFELLDKNGYFERVSDDTYKSAFPNRDKLKKQREK